MAVDHALPIRVESRPAEFARWELLGPAEYTLIVADLRHASNEDLTGLERIARRNPRVPVLAVVRGTDTDIAFASGDLGCDGVIPEPVSSRKLRARIVRMLRSAADADPLETTALRLGSSIVGNSEPIRELRRRIVRVAGSAASVVVRGETGSGKELVARALHEFSVRSAGPFVAVNCAAVPEQVFEPELFGSRRGAFTDARDREGLVSHAHRGTLFLDELAELPRPLQAKLLRVLESGEVRPVGAREATRVDVRLLAATNASGTALRSGEIIRHDLWYRVADVVLDVPPLRERLEDLEVLAYALLEREDYGDVRLGSSASRVLREHDWPGNVRELRSTLVRSIAFSGASVLRARDIVIDGARDWRISPAFADRRPE